MSPDLPQTTMAQRIELSVEQGIARVDLARPDKRNALDLPMFRAIVDTQRELRRDRQVRAVVLAGLGADFCSGLDIRSVMGSRAAARALLWKWLPWQANLAQQVSIGWRRLPAPVLVAVHGRCWGGGLQIALGGDLRIAHPGATFSVMEGRWGLIPDMGGTLALRELLAQDQALKLTLTAEEVDAEAALRLGLVTEVSDSPVDRCLELAESLRQRSPDALAAAKRLHRKIGAREGPTLARETLYQLRILGGRNQRIASRRARGEKVAWRERGHW